MDDNAQQVPGGAPVTTPPPAAPVEPVVPPVSEPTPPPAAPVEPVVPPVSEPTPPPAGGQQPGGAGQPGM